LLLLLPLEVGRDGSLGAHDRPIDATASAIVDLSPRRTQLLSTSAVWVRAYARAVAAEVRRERGEQGERKASLAWQFGMGNQYSLVSELDGYEYGDNFLSMGDACT
jgi:hypothetical protein